MKKRIILVGPAASGKDLMKDYLVDVIGLQREVSYTTRPKREGEIEGVTYDYLTRQVFNAVKRDGGFYEAVEFNGWMYGTTHTRWNSAEVFIMTPSGVKHITAEDRKECVIVYFDIPIEVRRERLAKRSDADSADRRVAADQADFKDFVDFDLHFFDHKFSPETVYKYIQNAQAY
jgi:guanylate kinase